MDKKIDITSSVVEQGLDIAKGFLEKLIMPAVEEVGLLAKDQITLWRFERQVGMLNKSKKYCEKNNIDPKTISLKVLCPLLDYSGLEEDDEMQDKWAILLGNMVDSEQNVENHVFPYILSQISKNEFGVIEAAFNSKRDRVNNLTQELNRFINDRPGIEATLTQEIKYLNRKINENKDYSIFSNRTELNQQKRKAEIELSNLKYKESSFGHKMREPEKISDKNVKDFEVSNLIRLGVVKEVRESYVRSQTLEIPNNQNDSHLSVDFDIDVESNDSFVLTELGELFIQACTNKS